MKYILRKIWRGVRMEFDKVFYNGKAQQFLWVAGIVVIMVAISWLGGLIFGVTDNLRVIELFLDPGSFQGAADDGNGNVIFQLVITILGSVCFTCFLINSVDNWLERRVNSYQKGTVYYDFDNHVVILGANDMLLNLLKMLLDQPNGKKQDIAILTSQDAEDVRAKIRANFNKMDIKRVYVMYGDRSHADTLQRIDVHEATQIYILGEENEPMHDAINIKCYNLLKDICAKSANIINCSMELDRLASINHFYFNSEGESTDKLRLSIINAPEGIAQRVLVSRNYAGKKYPALDRDGIGADSEIGVHLVLVGITQISYALAATAAHACHFPNFISKGIRTRITFIAPNIREEMDFFRGRYQSLMQLSYSRYIDLNDSSKSEEFPPMPQYLAPDSDAKGYLDIEWEFINGDIACDGARQYIRECAAKEGKAEYLTIAFCSDTPEENIAACQYMPYEVYESEIPFLVYQLGEDELVNSIQDTYMYKNVHPFGMKSDSYDSEYLKRLAAAKRICYLYEVCDNFNSFPSDRELSDKWYKKRYWEQLSNIYAANSIPFKLRSINYSGTGKFTAEEINLLSETEHNRWNMERLLIGFRTYPFNERKKINAALASKDKTEAEGTCKEIKFNKVNKLIHKDIAPYSELDTGTKNYDIVIIKNLPEVIK